jgi:hypothetical protein
MENREDEQQFSFASILDSSAPISNVKKVMKDMLDE